MTGTARLSDSCHKTCPRLSMSYMKMFLVDNLPQSSKYSKLPAGGREVHEGRWRKYEKYECKPGGMLVS
jgi:hypothetical protein